MQEVGAKMCSTDEFTQSFSTARTTLLPSINREATQALVRTNPSPPLYLLFSLSRSCACTEYRSAIFYHSPEQLEIAKRVTEEVQAKHFTPKGTFPTPFTPSFETQRSEVVRVITELEHVD